ncbi:MAG: nicotinate phosphoribosyltransferase [Chloroflexi bacterium]|nr:MAG: nicotinate phosphoribosyltransferase [Chloroflexota bacterium]TME57122.1 MAG: nicotinate phosphoribosyltransferase [Chloroflexota bacterium]
MRPPTVNALLTDLYELNMAASYLRRGMTGTATFSLFVRSLPAMRGFLVAAGVESCLDLLADFRFEEEDIRYLRETQGYAEGDLEAFRKLRFTGDVCAIPEGRIALAGEPILEVTAPLPEAQLVETLFLNQVTFETTIASKAARCVIAARGRDVVDFAFRRTQGIEAGIDVARLSTMVGFAATSNVEAARRHGLVAAGTMAHSYIEAFANETEAFRAFAQDFPGRATFLVDTYNTMTGIKHAIEVIKELGLGGRLGIRIDSGDLVALSKRGRRMLDGAGLSQVRIFASGGLDELAIDELVRDGALIDAFGVGTRMGVSADHPYLDTAYKLVSYKGRPVMKLSSGKVSAPGRKQVFRRSKPFSDLVGLHDEKAPAGRERVLEALMVAGARRGGRPPIAEVRARFAADLERLPASARAIRSPRPLTAQSTPRLRNLTAVTRQRLVMSSKTG